VPSHSKESEAAFATRLKPVLEYYCTECHNPRLAPVFGGLDLTTGRAAMTTGSHAPVILPGHPDQSLLVTVLRLGHEEVFGMPPAPDKISDDEFNGVRAWIQQGAHWPTGEKGRLKVPVDGTAAESH
jgi:mono/diheme cytochrome c family protein